MKFKLVFAFVNDSYTSDVLAAAREAGATGASIISRVRGDGLAASRTFFGLDTQTRCDALLFLVPEDRAPAILDAAATAGRFRDEGGAGIAFQVAVESAVGLETQLAALRDDRAGD